MQIKAQGELPSDIITRDGEHRRAGQPGNAHRAIPVQRAGMGRLLADVAAARASPICDAVCGAGELAGSPVILGIREQLHDPTQADGYAWLPPSASLAPTVDALRALGAREGFNAVDLLLPEDALPDLKAQFRLDYQTTIDLWMRET